MYLSSRFTSLFLTGVLAWAFLACSKEEPEPETLVFDESLVYNPTISASRDTSWAYLQRGRIDSAVLHALNRIERAEQQDVPKELLVDSYHHLAKVLLRAGVYDLHRTYNLKSLELYREYFGNQPSFLMVNFYASIAASYLSQQNTKKALEYYRKTEKAAAEIGQHLIVCGSLNNIGIAHLKAKNIDSAKIYFERAQGCVQQVQEPFNELVFAIGNNLGDLYYQIKDYHTSDEYFRRNHQLLQTMPDEIFYDKRMVTSNIGMARNALAKGRAREASGYLQTAEAHLPKVWFNFQLKLAKEVLQLRLRESFLNNDLKTYQKISIENEALMDSTHKLEAEVSMLAIEKMAKLQIEMTNLKIAAKDRELLIAYKEKQTTWLLTLMFGVIIFITGGFLLILVRRRNKQMAVERMLALSELEKKALEEEKMKLLVTNQKHDITELSAHTYHLRQLTKETQGKLRVMRSLKPEEQKSELSELSGLLDRQVNQNKARELIHQNIEDVNATFFQRLDELATGTLSKREKELCALFKLDLPVKQIAEIQGVGVSAIRVSRFRIRKKLGLAKEQDLTLFLQDS